MPDDTRPTTTQDAGPRFRYTAALADEIESRWQSRWDAARAFRALNPGDAGFNPSRPKFYALDMFPYPSGSGLHVGHPEGYTATDILARKRRMQGYNVLHPMGWDAFGLPAEQYAIATNVHPRETTRAAIDTFRRQLKRFGFSYDWEREFATIDPDYYKWTQWIFLRFYNAWYDPRANDGRGGARPIDSLVEDLSQKRLLVSPDGAVVPADKVSRDLSALEGGVAHGVLRTWHDLTDEQRDALVHEHRLAYLGEQTVNWCAALGTVLANEEIIDGRSERGGHTVRRVPMRQWMFRITAYAERLIDDLALVDWPESTKAQQAEWIGRSEGAEIDFPLLAPSGEPTGETVRVFTTRPDTVFGATYLVLAPEHDAVDDLAAPEQRAAIDAYRRRVCSLSDVERQESKEKTGVFTGGHALNPVSGERVPVWIADYVLMSYGTGAIMAVPAHDQRDFEFAKAFGLPIRAVVRPDDDGAWAKVAACEECFPGVGVAVESSNSEVSINGLPTVEAKRAIVEWIEKSGVGASRVNYRLRDWLFSRQRYWGEPFPIVFDEAGNPVALREGDLPVRLPELENFKPDTGNADSPTPLLATATDWLRVQIDGRWYTRETNTMPNWAGSCWYYLRYCDPRNAERFIGKDAERYWLGNASPEGGSPARWGVDLYMGGAEHATLHLLYARFWHKALFDLGEVSTPEPFRTLRHQGLIQSFAYQRAREDGGGLVPTDMVEEREEGVFFERATGKPVTQIVAKMSKSLKNVVNPDDVIREFGADTFRLYEMYLGPIEASKPWNPRDIVGLFRFLQRVWRLGVDEETGSLRLAGARDEATERLLHKTIKKVGDDIDRLGFNTAIASMIEFVNGAMKTGVTLDQLERFTLILCPFAPHIAEELWAKAHGEDAGFASLSEWPSYDESMLASETVEILVQVLGKPRDRLVAPADADEKTLERLALESPKVQEAIAGKTVRKVIVARGRLVNIVVG
ncbi:MAG: leucine--tRNA ligase [Phycisphaeraceae bacterium]|nr:leucine--tRNA ligase [Phycisphaeraceae bacterium]